MRWENPDDSNTCPPLVGRRPYPPRRLRKGQALLDTLTTTDPKKLGLMYLFTSFAFFMIGGVMALMMRAELAVPGMQFLSNEQYNQLFTLHGTIMLLLYATPIVFGFANYILPLQIGAPDVAFPRLNALSYWLYLFGALITISGFITPEARPISGGLRMHRCPPTHSRPAPGPTSGLPDLHWPESEPFSEPST